MNNILTAYCEPSDSMTSFKLNPTGRWKLVTNRFNRTWLYIEHKRFWRFTTWMHEENIKFYDKKEATFDCKANKKRGRKMFVLVGLIAFIVILWQVLNQNESASNDKNINGEKNT